MTHLTAEQKAAKRRERRQARRKLKKSSAPEAKLRAGQNYPMIYQKDRPKNYAEGIQSTGSACLVKLPGKPGEEDTFCNITCYGKRNVPMIPHGQIYDWVVEYYIPIAQLSKLGKKKTTSVDVLTRNKEKRGTLTATEKTFSLLAQRGDLSISGDLSRVQLAEALHDKTFFGFATIVKTAQEPKHEHNWEVQKGVYSPVQADPTSIYTCTTCGVKLITMASHPVPPTRGCTGHA